MWQVLHVLSIVLPIGGLLLGGIGSGLVFSMLIDPDSLLSVGVYAIAIGSGCIVIGALIELGHFLATRRYRPTPSSPSSD